MIAIIESVMSEERLIIEWNLTNKIEISIQINNFLQMKIFYVHYIYCVEPLIRSHVAFIYIVSARDCMLWFSLLMMEAFYLSITDIYRYIYCSNYERIQFIIFLWFIIGISLVQSTEKIYRSITEFLSWADSIYWSIGSMCVVGKGLRDLFGLGI